MLLNKNHKFSMAKSPQHPPRNVREPGSQHLPYRRNSLCRERSSTWSEKRSSSGQGKIVTLRFKLRTLCLFVSAPEWIHSQNHRAPRELWARSTRQAGQCSRKGPPKMLTAALRTIKSGATRTCESAEVMQNTMKALQGHLCWGLRTWGLPNGVCRPYDSKSEICPGRTQEVAALPLQVLTFPKLWPSAHGIGSEAN